MRWLVGVFAIAACTQPQPERPLPPPPVDVEPTLAMIAPDRGTFVEGRTLAVTGRVHDDGAVRVTVNGRDATLAADGTFTVALALSPGITIVETHAIDTTGHDVRDVRSVLAGPFATSDGSARGAIAARLGRGGLTALGKALARSTRALDFTAAGQALNPVYDEGNCIGARVDIATLAVGAIDVALVPKPGAIDTAVTVDDVVVHLDVHYKVACIGGTTTMTVRTRARVRGDLRLALADGRIHTALSGPAVTLEDFHVDIGGLPRVIELLVTSRIRGSIESALTKAIETKLPPLADAKLAELLAKPPATTLLGHALAIDVVPRKLELSSSGLFIAADSSLVVAGGESGRYVSTRAVITDVASDGSDAGAWIATDTLDQLLAGLWAAHAFERTLSVADVGPLAMLLGDQVHTIDIALSLPPTVRADDVLELAVGDLIVTLRDATGAELQRFAISLRSTLRVKPGQLALATTEPAIFAQLLGGNATAAHSLDAGAVEGLVKLAWSLVAGMLDDALTRVPIPDLGGGVLTISAARDGVIVLGVTGVH